MNKQQSNKECCEWASDSEPIRLRPWLNKPRRAPYQPFCANVLSQLHHQPRDRRAPLHAAGARDLCSAKK
jgi:hypothetical protein